jgi:hypothetical protein
MGKESLGNIIRDGNGWDGYIAYGDVEKHCQCAVDVLLRQSVWSSMEDSIINSFKHNLRVDVNSGLWQIK